MRLQSKVAIVTGGGQGIGLAYAERFLREGACVVLAELDEKRGRQGLRSLSGLGDVEFIQTDVSDPSSAEECASRTTERFGGIDILINNAAIYGDWDTHDQSYAYLQRMFAVNLHGAWLMSRAVSPHLVERGGGRILNQASAAAYSYSHLLPTEEFPGLGSFNYQQTKWGVIGLTKFMASQLGHWHITVNCIAPGATATDATRAAIPPDTLAAIARQQAIPGVLEPRDLTGAAVYLASDEARFVTGQVLVIDGGRHMPA